MKILVIHPDEARRDRLQQTLTATGYQTQLVASGSAALEYLSKDAADLILLADNLVEMSGQVFCQKASELGSGFCQPAIFLTNDETVREQIATGRVSGPADFVSAEPTPAELCARVNLMRRLKQAEDQLQYVAPADAATGLYSRALVFKRLEEELARARRHHRTLACVRLSLAGLRQADVDAAWASAVLQGAARLLKANSRQEDMLARFNEEGFLVILSDYTVEAAWVYGERMRKTLAAHYGLPTERGTKLQVRVGIACYGNDQVIETAEELIARAGEALNQAEQLPNCGLVVSLSLDDGDNIMCW